MPAFLLDPFNCVEVTQLDYVHLAWTATSLGALFSHYEIQRSDDLDPAWYQIASITTEATVTFDDHEARWGVSSQYRLRVVRTDLAVSDWTAVAVAHPDAQHCELGFVSNYDPTLNVAYNREPSIDYEYPSAAEEVLAPIYGRFGRVSLNPTEERGTEFTVPMVVHAGELAPARQGNRAFDPIRALARADLPYVCVLDKFGNRFLASLAVPKGSNREPGYLYIAEVRVAEVTDTPYVVSTP